MKPTPYLPAGPPCAHAPVCANALPALGPMRPATPHRISVSYMAMFPVMVTDGDGGALIIVLVATVNPTARAAAGSRWLYALGRGGIGLGPDSGDGQGWDAAIMLDGQGGCFFILLQHLPGSVSLSHQIHLRPAY